MLLAPFTLTDTPARRSVARRAKSRRIPSWLLAWAALGMLAACLVPGLGGNALTGMSLPFWLVAAPLIDIAWLTRSRWPSLLRALRVRLIAATASNRRRTR